MLSRAVADTELHSLLEIFVDAGVLFQLHHIKILACRLLHRGMSANAVKMIQACRDQVLARSVNRREWELTLKREVLENTSWNERVSTIQIEGGVGGGVFRIHGIPKDGITFIQIVNSFVQELNEGTGRVVERRASMPFAPPTEVKLGRWKRFKTRVVKYFKKKA